MTQVLLQADRPIPDLYHDSTTDANLCQKFKYFTYNNSTSNNNQRRRRIFAGGLIADDSWHVIGASSLETYGIFHSITFVESNRTQGYTARQFRFEETSEDYEILTRLYGPDTPVYVEQFVYERKEPPMMREHMMRQRILEKWKELGMKKDDIGLIIDPDEIPSRQFLRAAQICHLPEDNWRTDESQNCHSPSVLLSFPMFEGSPKCIHKAWNEEAIFARFIPTQMVIGACIEGIGDDEKHPVIPRKHTDMYGKPVGAREKGYGEKFDYSKFLNNTKNNEKILFPLYNAADMRRMAHETIIYGGVGFHLHNFFDSAEQIRFKYSSYGHIHKHAFTVPFGAMNGDMNVLVKCVHNLNDEGNRKRRLDNGLALLKKDIPAAFKIEGYIEARHEELISMVIRDEEEYGRADKFDGHKLYKEELHLTHPGRIQKENNNNNTQVQ